MMEHFPIIHTNFWDAVIAVPVVMILTQLVKKFFNIKPFWVPTIALIIGLLISIFISHRHNLLAGVFMGWFYGYSAIGSFSSLKASLIAYKNKKIGLTINPHRLSCPFCLICEIKVPILMKK